MSAEKALSNLNFFQLHPGIFTIPTIILGIVVIITLIMTIGTQDSKIIKTHLFTIGASVFIIIGLTGIQSYLNLTKTQLKDLQATPHKIVSVQTVNLDMIPNSQSYFTKSGKTTSYFTTSNGISNRQDVPKYAIVSTVNSDKSGQPKNVLKIQTIQYENKTVDDIIPIDANNDASTHLQYVFSK